MKIADYLRSLDRYHLKYVIQWVEKKGVDTFEQLWKECDPDELLSLASILDIHKWNTRLFVHAKYRCVDMLRRYTDNPDIIAMMDYILRFVTSDMPIVDFASGKEHYSLAVPSMFNRPESALLDAVRSARSHTTIDTVRQTIRALTYFIDDTEYAYQRCGELIDDTLSGVVLKAAKEKGL